MSRWFRQDTDALVFGIGIGLCIDPTLRAWCGSWVGLVGVAMVIGAMAAGWPWRGAR